MREEIRAMDKKDMALLIEAEDAINDMDRLLVQLTSMGHSDRLFNKIDNVYEVIMNNYLIQHSAGSGKSNSIAWLAHRLIGLHDYEDK